VSNIQHFPFKNEYPHLSQKLITDVEIFDSMQHQNVIRARALWDTGAMLSAITPEIATKLNLASINRIKVNGIGNFSIADIVRVSIRLPNLVELKNARISVLNLVKDVDMLIGMDIIQLGDFSISNGAGKTLFTFAMPPFDDKIDLYEKAIAVNRNNTRDSCR
jgi:predicted aspartyl protease